MKRKIAIIDYGVGNIKSITNAVSLFGTDTILTSDKKTIEASDAIILPGVGSFAHGMKNLKKLQLDKAIREYYRSERPIMGICLGMQLLMEEGSEFETVAGLGLVSGSVKKMNCSEGVAIPHIGWEQVRFNTAEEESDFFFCHSYEAIPTNEEDILALSNYENYKFCAAVQKNNLVGYQFHPEKSAQAGLRLIKQFIDNIERGE